MYDFVRRHPVGRHPVAEVQPVEQFARYGVAHLLVHGAVRGQPRLHIAQLGAHGLVRLLQQLAVAVLEVVFPGHRVQRCAPCHASSAGRLPGSAVGDVARGGVLRVAHIANPFLIEGCGIEVQHHHRRCYLSVARVGQTLAVGTVAGDASVHVVQL